MLLAVAALKIRDGIFIYFLFFILLCCVEKNTPELRDTTHHAFPVLFWECAIAIKSSIHYVPFMMQNPP